jgi:hypothetical protein
MPRPYILRAAYVAAAVALAAPGARAQIVTDGSFEQGPAITGAGSNAYVTLPVGSTALAGWTVFRGDIDVVGLPAWDASRGRSR